MSNQINVLIPAKAIHPGEMLKDELLARGITQKEFAQLTGIQATQINEIIKGKRNINSETALVIATALEMDVNLWVNLQAQYDLNKVRIVEKTSKRLQAIDLWNLLKQYIPLKFFKKQGILTGDPIKDIPLVKKIYMAADIEAMIALFSQPKFAHFRKSDKLEENKINLLGWQYLAAYRLSAQSILPFNPAIKDDLISELKTIICKNKNTVAKVATTLQDAGIKFIILNKPDKCPVDGVSLRSGNNPAIVLTMRHARIDNFAFTLFHELGHVFLHLNSNTDDIFINIDQKEVDKHYASSPKEIEANDFAKNALIADSEWKIYAGMPNYKKEDAVISFAKKQKIHPAIVKGRIRFESGNYALYGKLDSVN